MRALIEGSPYRSRCAMAALCFVAALGLPTNTSAEVKEVQIARGFAIPHLPIMIMEHDKLLEKHARAAGLGEVRVVYSTIGGGSVMNDSLISGALSFGVGGGRRQCSRSGTRHARASRLKGYVPKRPCRCCSTPAIPI